MNYIIDVNSSIHAYIQLYQFFRDDIVQCVYPYKTKLPSKRVTCSETNLSIITVEHAYDLLIQEGYIESKERSGYFVIFKPNIGFASYSSTEHLHKSNLATTHGLGDLSFPFSTLAKSMRKVLNDLDENILERSDNFGCYELRKNISLYLARSRGIHATPEQIVIGAGSEYLYGLIITLFGRDKKIAIETPSYKQIQHYVMENPTTVFYMCTASSDVCRNYEKDLKKLVKKDELQSTIIYVNLSDIDENQFVDAFNAVYPYKVSLFFKNVVLLLYTASILFTSSRFNRFFCISRASRISISSSKVSPRGDNSKVYR